MKTNFLPLLLSIAMLPASFATDCPGDLTRTVPPPPCLRQCITDLGECAITAPENKYTSCIAKLCAPKDQSYAEVYFGAISPCGGFLDYNTTPPHFEVVPPPSCDEVDEDLLVKGLRQKAFVA